MTVVAYADVDELKTTLGITGTAHDNDLEKSALAASDGIDRVCQRRFFTNGEETRYFTPDPTSRTLELGDFVSLTSLTMDTDADGVYDTAWTAGTDYLLEPYNAALDEQPYERVCITPATSLRFPSYPKSVEAVGVFGWDTTPAGVVEYAGMLAAKLFTRKREAPLGFVISGEVAARIAFRDPDFEFLVGPYIRGRRGFRSLQLG